MHTLPQLAGRLVWSCVAALALQTTVAHAEMIAPDAVIGDAAPSQAEQDRAKVQQFLDRSNVKQRLQAMGVGGLNATERVASLSDEEVHALAQRIDTMPAGGRLSETDMILIGVIALLVIVAL